MPGMHSGCGGADRSPGGVTPHPFGSSASTSPLPHLLQQVPGMHSGCGGAGPAGSAPYPWVTLAIFFSECSPVIDRMVPDLPRMTSESVSAPPAV